jgi:hypothetical protein
MRLFQIFAFTFLLISSKSQVSQNIEFEQSKGKWTFPISKFIAYVKEEGRKSTANDFDHKGIIFFTNKDDSVKASFKGKVALIFPVGDCFALMTKYGDYFITYVNLDSPVVKKGDNVSQGQFLGFLVRGYEKLELTITDHNAKEFDPYKWFKWPSSEK